MKNTESFQAAMEKTFAPSRVSEAESIRCENAVEVAGESEGQFLLGKSLLEGGKIEHSITTFAAALALAPGGAHIHLALATALFRCRRLGKAGAAAIRAIELGLTESTNLVRAAGILVRAGRHADAVASLQNAARIEPHSFDILRALAEALARQGRFADASNAFMRLVHLAPDDWTTHHNLAVMLRKLGRLADSIGPLERAVQLQPERANLRHVLALTLIESGRPAVAVPYYLEAVHKVPGALQRKATFYALRSIFEAIWDTQGPEVSYGAAITLLSHVTPSVWSERFGPRRTETLKFLAGIRDQTPATPFDRGIDLLLECRPVEALRAYAAHLGTVETLPAKYATVIEVGPDMAHPAWHLMNPYFYLWADGTLREGMTAQGQWRTRDVFDTPMTVAQLLDDYGAWLTNTVSSRDELKRSIAELAPSGNRAIDIGCGFGQVLRFLATDCGLAPEGVFGCDLRQGRVSSARRLLAATARERGLPTAVARTIASQNVFICDVLAWDADAFVARHGVVDLVTLFVITGCFDDDQLHNFLARVARLGARRIFETSVVDSWELWVGRKDISSHLLRQGYRCTRRRWPGEALEGKARHLVLPRKYWPGHQISVYDRV